MFKTYNLFKPAFMLALFYLVLFSPFSNATEFTTDFESQNITTAQTITVTNNGLSITLTGGTAFRIGNGSLYHSGIKSWMLDPAGSTTRGTSTGNGLITFSENALSVDFYIRTMNPSSGAQVVISDSIGAVLLDDSATGSTQWNHISLALDEGDALINQIEISATGTDMLAIDDFSFSTSTVMGSSSSGSLSFVFLMLLCLFIVRPIVQA
jgi:hypothetical protein